MYAAPLLPQLVPTALSVRLRWISLRKPLTQLKEPLMSTHAVIADPVAEFAVDVRAGLARRGQKELPSKYLYDAAGSALFEVISLLPEYGLTRADERILQHHAREIVAQLPLSVVVAELGSGSGKKTRWILEALSQRKPTAYYPIEISSAALAM